MKKIKLIIILLTISSLFSVSAVVTQDNSLIVAKNVFKQFSETGNINNFNIRSVDIIKSDNNLNLIYIYNLEPMGFIIVSGSSRGIGAAIARELASEGYPVIINYLNSINNNIFR